MKTIKTLLLLVALATVSFTAFAAEHVSAQDAAQFEKAGGSSPAAQPTVSSLTSAGRQSRCRRAGLSPSPLPAATT